MGPSGRRESRRNDTTGLAEQKEMVPLVGGDNIVPVRSKEARLEVEWTKKMTGGIREQDSGGPVDKLGRVG